MNTQTAIDPSLLAWVYDQTIQDWPGEWDFYLGLAEEFLGVSGAILEIGCGTGRIALRLASHGYSVTGLDISQAMLERAREKNIDPANPRWIRSDMRDFQLDQTYGLAIIPGHSFQFMITAEAQMDCLTCIKKHLDRNGKLVIHVNHDDLNWLATLPTTPTQPSEIVSEIPFPAGGHLLRRLQAWSYQNVTQTATSLVVHEEVGDKGVVLNRWQSEPAFLHCLFPTEIQHLASRAGFAVEAIYGDFTRAELKEDSADIILVLQK